MNSKITVGYQQVTSEIQLELEELREAIREINATLTNILRVLEQKTELERQLLEVQQLFEKGIITESEAALRRESLVKNV